MELLQLRYFLDSARNENFTRTAKKYNVPTTSVSASIRRLENELGTSLFERSANRIHLSVAGIRLYSTLSPLIADLDETVTELSNAVQDTRVIRLLIRGIRRQMIDITVAFTKMHPNVHYEFVMEYANERFEDFDIIIDSENKNYPGFEQMVFEQKKMVIKAAADDPLVGRVLTFKDLKNRDFVLTKIRGFSHMRLLDAAKKAGFTLRVAAVSSDVECFEKLIASGVGVGLGLHYDNEHTTNIVPLNVTDLDIHYNVCAYYQKKDYYGNVRSYIDFLKVWNEIEH